MTRPALALAVLVGFAMAPSAVSAQSGAPAAGPAASTPRPAADPKDVESIDAIMAAVYAAISGPPGPRQWDRFRSLMAPGARLVPTGRTASGEGRLRNWSVEEYIAAAGPGLEGGFFERELGRKMERYGNVVHLMSAYDSKRWYVVSIFWEAETPDNPIPAEFLNGAYP